LDDFPVPIVNYQPKVGGCQIDFSGASCHTPGDPSILQRWIIARGKASLTMTLEEIEPGSQTGKR
jgi:hypothetical protein